MTLPILDTLQKKKMKKIFAGEGRYSQPDTKRLKD